MSDCVSFGLSIHFTLFLSVFTYPLLWPTCFLVSRSNPLSSQLLNQKQMFPILMKISQVKIPNWHHQMVCTGTSCEAAFSSSSGGEPNSTGDPLFLILSPCLKVRTFDWWESLMFVEDAGWETVKCQTVSWKQYPVLLTNADLHCVPFAGGVEHILLRPVSLKKCSK